MPSAQEAKSLEGREEFRRARRVREVEFVESRKKVPVTVNCTYFFVSWKREVGLWHDTLAPYAGSAGARA
jgi:hypothetical protein